MDKYKLKWRIFVFLLAFCALLLIILWLFQTVFLRDMYKFIRTREMDNAIHFVEQNIENPNLSAILRDLEAEKEIIIVPVHEFIPPLRAAINQNRPRLESITQTKTFTRSDGQTISLTFFAMISPVEATVSTLQMQLSIITGIMIFLAVIVAVIIARRISKPIEELNQGAKALAAGNQAAHFNGKGFLEIKELSDTLNTAAAELSKTEALRRELMANISHDLRTPLALIYGYAEMMHDFPGEVTPEQLQILMEETKRLSSLVNDILDVSQLEAGVMELTKTRYNLTANLRAGTATMAELVKKDGYSFSFLYDGDVYVHADEAKITRVFYNLLINAVHYSSPEQGITVTQSVSDNMVTVTVIDKGEGVASQDLPYIWERYYKVDKQHKRAVTGTGLGLSIVKKIIEQHGGQCGAASQPGKGSAFWFRLERV